MLHKTSCTLRQENFVYVPYAFIVSSKANTLFFLLLISFFLKENVRFLVWTCRDPISLILGTRFSLILRAR